MELLRRKDGMFLPEIVYRKWEIAEPFGLGIISAGGSAATFLLAQGATTPAEYGAIFLAFLVFLGLGVLSIAGYAAHKIVTTAIDAFTKFAGGQAEKLEGLPDADELEKRFEKEADSRSKTETAIVATLKGVEKGIAELTTMNRLMAQSIETHEKRLDRHFELLTKEGKAS